MKKETGGPAFPFTPTQDRHMKTDGMTLRDYFAAKVMQSLYIRAGGSPAIDADSCDYFAHHAYQMADAMLKARGAE